MFVAGASFATTDRDVRPPTGYRILVVTYEQLVACGFDPQDTRLACTVRIKQMSGYGGEIAGIGSFEHVLFCLDWDGNGKFSRREIVGEKTLHVHDESAGNSPPWEYVVDLDFMPLGGVRTSADFTSTMSATQTEGPTYAARAVLSWDTSPVGCNTKPSYGNVVNFRVRFDPAR
ncbi:MAG: hypothetical protein V3T72_05600 [Thermoanaerobaculia bacterium]